MKKSEEKPIFQPKISPTKQHQDIEGDAHNHEEEVLYKGCDWFCLFCRKRRRNDGVNETDSLLPSDSEPAGAETWWETKLKKVKEISEKLAGPKWKNFIRKMSGYFNKRKSQKNRFQYDPYSYALNFDNGNKGDDHTEGDHLLHDFSYRFAASFADDRQRSGSGM